MQKAFLFLKQTFRTKRVVSVAVLVVLGLAVSVALYALYQVNPEKIYLYLGRIGQALRPACTTHNDCPGNWMYCISGQCYSYTTGGGVGAGCNVNKDCGNMMLNCVNRTCQRVVGEPGGCRVSQDCVDQYRNTNPGFWSCTNSQCIKLGGRPDGNDQYWNGTEWVRYGSAAACILNSDCGPGAFCDEYACVWRVNRDQCHGDGECGLLPSDPNAKYICVDASGNRITAQGYQQGITGTCQLLANACDLLTCGPGQHCEVRTYPRNTGGDRQPYCASDTGTVSVNGQPPSGWNSISCPGGTVIERCSNSATSQRVRYCSNDPNYATNAIRWNGWVGPHGEWCTVQGEAWPNQWTTPVNISSGTSTPPSGFYNTAGCALGTRIERCSNTYPGQRVSYCPEDEANPEKSVIRWNNWVGPNGETCSIQGEVQSKSGLKTASPTPTRTPVKSTLSRWLRGVLKFK